MFKILAWAAAILGALALLLLLLIVLALLTRVRVDLDKPEGGPLRLVIGYGPLRLPLLPLRKKKAAGKPVKTRPEKPKPEKPAAGGFSIKNVDIGDAICLALTLLDELKNRLVIHRLRADVMIATGDAAKTGILLGRSAAVTGMILPFLEQNFSIPDFHIAVDGDFQAEAPRTRFSFCAAASLRPLHLLLIFLKYRRKLMQLYSDLKKTDEKTEEKENAK